MNLELLTEWKKRLERFEDRPEIAKGMETTTAMGVQHGRTVALKQCIEDLERCIMKQ